MFNASKEAITNWCLFLLGMLATLASIFRVFGDDWIRSGLDQTTLLYLGVAAALLLFREVKSLAFGDYKVEFQERLKKVEENVSEVGASINKVEADIKGVAGALLDGPGVSTAIQEVAEDVQKNKWGGSREDNSKYRCVRAGKIRPLKADADFYWIPLWVESTNPKEHPLRDKQTVRFHLHQSFGEEPIVVPVMRGVAKRTLVAYGAFTVGIEVLDEWGAVESKLEIDLADNDIDAPDDFKRA